MMMELTQDEVERVTGGWLSQPVRIESGFGGFTTTSSTSSARAFVLARDRFLRSNPSVTAMDFGFPNLP